MCWTYMDNLIDILLYVSKGYNELATVKCYDMPTKQDMDYYAIISSISICCQITNITDLIC